MPSIYLAGPLDYAVLDDSLRSWRAAAKVSLGRDFAIFDPNTAFAGEPLSEPSFIREVNLGAVRNCDFLLGLVVPDEPSWGTPIEIQEAEWAGATVVLFAPAGKVPPYLAHHRAFRELAEACAFIRARRTAGSGVVELGSEGVSLRKTPDAGTVYATVAAIDEPKLPGDAGYDVFLRKTMVLIPKTSSYKLEVGMVCGQLKIAAPPGTWCCFMPRSSAIDRGIVVHQSVIDAGYRGPLYLFLTYHGDEPTRVDAGQSIAQLVFFKTVAPKLETGVPLPPGDRGERGFGSTGL